VSDKNRKKEYSRKMWPDDKHKVFRFICLGYPKNALCNEEKFDDVWQIGTAKMSYAKTHLKQYTRIALSAHAFTRSTLAAIMQSPIFTYSRQNDDILHFTLDAPPLFTKRYGKLQMRPQFTLEYATGNIIGLNGQGNVHKMYGTNTLPSLKTHPTNRRRASTW